MKLYVKCARCGGDIETDVETVKNAAALGNDDLRIEHEPGGCPNEAGVPAAPQTTRRFRAQVMLVELPPPGDPAYDGFDEEQVVKGFGVQFPPPFLVNGATGGPPLEYLIGVGKTVEARNAAEAVNGPLTTWLSETWPKMQENAAFADVPAAPLATPQT